jgi:peptidoglycan/LPS O-acetylase OafA/YrhL
MGAMSDSLSLSSAYAPVFRASPRLGYVEEIDAVRALAVGFVMFKHVGLLPFGWSGVWIFFVVSGFAVTSSLLRAETGPRLKRVYHFYVRRCLRIWPLYFLFIIANVIVLSIIGKSKPLDDVPYLFCFIYNLKLIFTDFSDGTSSWSPFGPCWTLAVEEQFYVIFPWLFVFLPRKRLIASLIGFIAIAPLIRFGWGHWIASLGWPPLRVALSVYAFAPAHFDAFAAGCLIALFREPIQNAKSAVHLLSCFVLACAAVYSAVFVAMQSLYLAPSMAFRNVISGILIGDLREVFVYPVMWSMAAALLMLIIAGDRRIVSACRLPVLQAIGRVSFGVYLFNMPAIMVMGAMLSGSQFATLPHAITDVLILMGALPLSVIVAWVSFQYFERPLLRFRSHFG